jgi:hypothetical protein
LGTGVTKYSLLNHNSAESRILSNSAIIPTSENSDTTILLNEIFPNSELAGKEKSEANQSN